MKDLVIAFVFLVCIGGAFIGLMKELSGTQQNIYNIFTK